MERTPHRVRQHNACCRPARLQGACDARKGAARAAGTGEGINLPASLVPNLGPRGCLMHRAIGKVVELIGVNRAELLGQAAAEMNVIARVRERLGRHQAKISADHAEKIELFAALRLWHHNDAAIAARIGNQCDANTGIARRTFHNCAGLAGR